MAHEQFKGLDIETMTGREVRVSMTITSLLSDVQETLGWQFTETQQVVDMKRKNDARLNYAKWLLNKYPDTDVWVDNDADEHEFNECMAARMNRFNG